MSINDETIRMVVYKLNSLNEKDIDKINDFFHENNYRLKKQRNVKTNGVIQDFNLSPYSVFSTYTRPIIIENLKKSEGSIINVVEVSNKVKIIWSLLGDNIKSLFNTVSFNLGYKPRVTMAVKNDKLMRIRLNRNKNI